jgi:hypothetical protein
MKIDYKHTYLGVKWLGREADYSPPPSAEVNNAWSYTYNSSSTPSWRGAKLRKGGSHHLPLHAFTS